MAAAITHNYMLVCNIGLLSAVTIIARLLQKASVMMADIQYLINYKASIPSTNTVMSDNILCCFFHTKCFSLNFM